MKLSGNTILITGAGSGIGRALALHFAKLDNQVIICGRRKNRLEEVAQMNANIDYQPCDISSPEDRNRLYEFCKEKYPQLNVLVNNCAVQTDYDLLAGTPGLEYAEKEIDINLTAPILLTGMFLPDIMKQKDPVIVNVTSILGFMPLTRIPIYCAAKAGFHVYTLVLRKQLEGTGVKVFDVPPPRVETELNPEGRRKAALAGTDSAGSLMPEEYAAYVIEHLGNDELDIFYGEGGELVKNVPRPVSEGSRLN